MKDRKYFYPTLPDSYTYLDPPYEIARQRRPERAGLGRDWSASDMARFGHLNATRGLWKGEQIIDPDWLRPHSGGNKSGSSGESKYFTALGVVTTERTARVQTRHRDPEHPSGGPVCRPGQSETLTIADSERPVVTMM